MAVTRVWEGKFSETANCEWRFDIVKEAGRASLRK